MPSLQVRAVQIIDAPVSLVWEIVADLDAYHRHVGSLAESTVVEGAGEGAQRRCVDTAGSTWTETCTVWDPERRYVIEVDVSSYPLKYRGLFRAFKGTWVLEPNGQGAQLNLTFDIELRRVPGLSALTGRLGRRARSDVEDIATSYAAAAARRVAGQDL